MKAQSVQWASRPAARNWTSAPVRGKAREFHTSMPGYRPTPLVELPELATELDVRAVLVKDESDRLGLPAFKIPGASWAVNCALGVAAGACGGASLDGVRAALRDSEHRAALAVSEDSVLVLIGTDGAV